MRLSHSHNGWFSVLALLLATPVPFWEHEANRAKTDKSGLAMLGEDSNREAGSRLEQFVSVISQAAAERWS